MGRCAQVVLITLLLAVGGHASAQILAQQTQYKEIPVGPVRQDYFALIATQHDLSLQLPGDSAPVAVSVRRSRINVTAETVTADGRPLFDSSGVHIGATVLPYDRITDVNISDTTDHGVVLRFFTSPTATQRTAVMHRGNRISYAAPIEVNAGDFVRGMVFTVLGSVRIDGEVNKDVVSLFGPVYVTQTAVVRGNVASITGAITTARAASVYGNTYSGLGDKFTRLRQRFQRERGFGYEPFFRYNKVDGFNPNFALHYRAVDSSLPTVWLNVGWAFASDRWRLKAGLQQRVLRRAPVVAGFEIYRRLASEDDWLLTDRENTVFALLAKEDFKDYWEGIGGRAWVAARPLKHVYAEVNYRNETTDWLSAHRNLWSLFGAGKRFSDNFGTVPAVLRTADSTILSVDRTITFGTTLEYDTHDQKDPYAKPGWTFAAALEWSDTSFSSTYQYRRYTLTVQRYQPITRFVTLALRGMFSDSDGLVPAHKRFFLGGLSTLWGYRHKEFIGTRFWMVNSVVRVPLPKTQFAVAALYDVAQIANDAPLDGASEVRNSIGGAVYIGSKAMFVVGRRLDSAKDRSPRIYVRLDQAF